MDPMLIMRGWGCLSLGEVLPIISALLVQLVPDHAPTYGLHVDRWAQIEERKHLLQPELGNRVGFTRYPHVETFSLKCSSGYNRQPYRETLPVSQPKLAQHP